MKRPLTGALALLFSSIAMSATTIPSSMINWTSIPTWPSVSAGLVFASPSGASGAPTFRALVATDLPTVTVAKGGTGSTTAAGARTALGAAASGANTDITSLSAPAIGAATAATASAGDSTTKVATTAYVQGAVTGGANAASFTTVNASGLITPSTTAGIKGTTAGDSANAGSIGEIRSNSTTTTSLTSGTPANATTLSLPAGHWLVFGLAQLNPAASTTTSSAVTGVSTTSAAFGTVATGINNYTLINYGTVGNASVGTSMNAPPTQVNVTSTTTVYLVAQAGFATSTMTVSGYLWAIRIR
ncbi:hypothetical protein [Burkholderia stagnalis]|uniref:hypothetical protein n=1 Tax=Burkholderia stagnalis TaxID=1503054 RepID=UPI000F57691A|nr:hypothetical protein [Burkholderia stagnalis]